jgi:hypothetical protein
MPGNIGSIMVIFGREQFGKAANDYSWKAHIYMNYRFIIPIGRDNGIPKIFRKKMCEKGGDYKRRTRK